MRDIVLTCIVAVLLPAALRWPHLGAYGWAWISLMNPHRAAWGFAQSIPFAMLIAMATVVGTVFTRNRHAFPISSLTVVYVLFLIWMSVTSLFALNQPEVVFERWVFVMKVHLMVFVTIILLRGRKQIEMLTWVVTLSIGFYGIKGGVFTALTGGSYRVWGPPYSMVEGNNELAVALVILVPFLSYFHRTVSRRWLRWLLLFAIVSCVLSILGSHSRGAFLALAAMAFFLGLKGQHPVRTTVLMASLLLAGVLFMPENWTSRMETIQTYEEDTSAMSRIYVWKTLWAAALDRPLTGVGFDTAMLQVFHLYAPPGFDQFTGATPVAHSIYFQALGEHGFPGLALYLSLGLLGWRTAGRLARETRNDKEFGTWVPQLMTCAQISLLGFAAGGTFLTLVHFDMPYYTVALVVLVDATVRDRRRALAFERGRMIQPSVLGVPK